MKLLMNNILLHDAYSSLKNTVFLLVVLLFATTAGAQAFSVSATVTHETCQGNGALGLSVQNADPCCPVNYKVYLLPDTTNTQWNSSNPNVPGLGAGTYLIIATQTINGNPVTTQTEATINNLTTPLAFSVSSEEATCGNDGSITVEVTSGNPVSYEIISPIVVPPQASNIFNNLGAGTYIVRVVDNCNNGPVVTHTLFSDGPVLNVGGPFFPDSQLPACDLITIGNQVMAATDVPIAYPLTVVITLYPPDGSDPIVYNQNITAGAPDIQEVTQVVPFYYNTEYHYTITVTDGCGVTYSPDPQQCIIDQRLTGQGGFEEEECNKFLIIGVDKYVAPYTITFLQFPNGEDPADYNPGHPGPFDTPTLHYGSPDNPVPLGVYEFVLTDACGRSFTYQTELEEPVIEPNIAVFNSDCENQLGYVEIVVPGYLIELGTITDSPPEYSTTDVDVSEYITDEGELIVTELPVGHYEATVIDNCGHEFDVVFDIPPFTSATRSIQQRPDCTLGKGSLSITTPFGPLTLMRIIEAPEEFGPTPQDVTANISSDGLYFSMDNLPPGYYEFEATDNCGNFTRESTVIGYTVSVNEYEETLHCGAFDLYASHASTGNAFANLWLQKLIDPETDAWGHPETGGLYTEGTFPNSDSSILLDNGETNYNFEYTGSFRVIKNFVAYGNSADDINTKDCIEVVYEFVFNDDVRIIDYFNLTCSGEIADVQVNAVGAEPLTYTITSKNGDTSFIINNGTNNVFTGLESAVYTVKVENDCGYFTTGSFNVAELPSLVAATTPPDMAVCDTGNNGTESFDLSLQNSTILDGQDPTLSILTYHATQDDAELGINPLAANYTSGPATVYARVTYVNDPACYVTTFFNISLNPTPVLTMEDKWSFCEGDDVTITADAGYSYLWSNGAETQEITVSTPGLYTVTVTDDNLCSTSKTVEVAASESPVISHITISDWTDNNNVLTVMLENTENTEIFEYSIDGITYQDSNTFTNLPSGMYTVYVRDKYGCGLDEEEAFLLTYPKFFTPNGDGVNETWRIKFSSNEPNMVVYIFDRYGKLITSFGPNSDGWDGTYNGSRLPSTDYWFLVKRENGKEYRGHFSMLR